MSFLKEGERETGYEKASGDARWWQSTPWDGKFLISLIHSFTFFQSGRGRTREEEERRGKEIEKRNCLSRLSAHFSRLFLGNTSPSDVAVLATFVPLFLHSTMKVALLLVAVAVCGVAVASDVLDLTTSNFESTLKNVDLALVEFYAPW